MSSRERSKFDILGKIEEERLKRGWSEYLLAQNSNISQSTISTWYRKKLQPSVASIEHICDGLGITLSQFFSENVSSEISSEQHALLESWQKLNPTQRTALLQFIKTL